MTNKLLHVQYERNAHCRSCSPGATSACHICNPIWSQADWGRPFLLHRKFINIQMWILPPACCLRTSWTAKQQKTGAYLLPTRKRQSKKSTQWQGLGPAYFFAKMFCFLYIFVKRLGHASSLWKSLLYDIQKSLLQILQQSQVSTHTTHLVAAALHGMHLHVQSNKHHNTKRNMTTLWSRRWNSFGAPARTGQPATCK